MSGELSTWQGRVDQVGLEGLVRPMGEAGAAFFGQRAAGFTLQRGGAVGPAEWAQGRCFNEVREIRFWTLEHGRQWGVLLLGEPLQGGGLLERKSVPYAEEEERYYLCLGQHEKGGKDKQPVWWESRYGQTLRYLDADPAPRKNPPDDHGRVYLKVRHYELEDGGTQHRLLGFTYLDREETDESV